VARHDERLADLEDSRRSFSSYLKALVVGLVLALAGFGLDIARALARH